MGKLMFLKVLKNIFSSESILYVKTGICYFQELSFKRPFVIAAMMY